MFAVFYKLDISTVFYFILLYSSFYLHLIVIVVLCILK